MGQFSSQQYWEQRYHQGGNSGQGSYGQPALLKSNYINSVIDKYNVKTINDLGHGDGNQIGMLKGFDSYVGYDVSPTIRQRCIDKYINDQRYTFIDHPDKFKKSDMVMSLDVLYHLVEDEVFEQYMDKLFSLSDLVLILAEDRDHQGSPHVLCRHFSSYVEQRHNTFQQIEKVDGYHNNVHFFLYQRI